MPCANSLRLPSCRIVGYTPLHMAVGYSFVSTVRILLEAGANPEIPDSQARNVVQLVDSIRDSMPFNPQLAQKRIALEEVSAMLTGCVLCFSAYTGACLVQYVDCGCYSVLSKFTLQALHLLWKFIRNHISILLHLWKGLTVFPWKTMAIVPCKHICKGCSSNACLSGLSTLPYSTTSSGIECTQLSCAAGNLFEEVIPRRILEERPLENGAKEYLVQWYDGEEDSWVSPSLLAWTFRPHPQLFSSHTVYVGRCAFSLDEERF